MQISLFLTVNNLFAKFIFFFFFFSTGNQHLLTLIVFRLGTMTVIGLQQDRVLIGPLGSKDRRVIGFDWSFGFRVSRAEQLLLVHWLMSPRRNVLLRNQFIDSYSFPLESYLIFFYSGRWQIGVFFLCAKEETHMCLKCSSLKNKILSHAFIN